MKNAFKKNKMEYGSPPPILLGDKIWEKVQNFSKVTKAPPYRFPGYGVTHNWTKQSIFWELPYWKDNFLRHNLYVMDVKGKTKDNPKARMDLQEYCRRSELYLQTTNNGKVFKPKASYTFTLEERRQICDWVTKLKMPEGYASNLGKKVDMEVGKLSHLKSHDCHVFMETLVHIAFCGLPERIWKPIIEISLFFKDLCSTTLREENLLWMDLNIHITSSKMEIIFPCGFFDVMEHLPIHLVHEARLGGLFNADGCIPLRGNIISLM